MGKFAPSPMGVVASVSRQLKVAQGLLREARSLRAESAAVLMEMRARQAEFDARKEEVLSAARKVATLAYERRVDEAASKPKELAMSSGAEGGAGPEFFLMPEREPEACCIAA